MNRKSPDEVTAILNEWSGGDNAALSELVPLLEDELKGLARAYMRRERRNHTLEPTALVNEAFLRLVRQRGVRWQSRAHFLGIAATSMRRVLVDHARARRSRKRGAGEAPLPLEELPESRLANSGGPLSPESLLALDEALDRLQNINERQSRIVELRYFIGLSNQEIAEALKISLATVKRDWTAARVILFRDLSGCAHQ
ncbi:MAG: sigma-70 family RNA polymerase sigma factor [Acidobacteriota bacterium]